MELVDIKNNYFGDKKSYNIFLYQRIYFTINNIKVHLYFFY